MDVSIVIPTKNGGDRLEEVLKAVFSQKTKYEYEVICVDSGSTDGTLDVIRRFPCRLYQIPPEEFGHGRTRNYGAGKGSGTYIMFLTQDALPVNENWLEAMIDAMEQDEAIAGGFGIHYPYPDCNILDKRDLPRHFRNFGEDNKVFYIDDKARYYEDKGYQQYLAFFSDNNSCLRRSVWERIPYQDVDFAEDQIWARQILEAGYKKVYCPHSAVYHSHNYPLKTYFHRYYDEFKGIYRVYQWKMCETLRGAFRQALAMDKQDVRYILSPKNGIPRKLHWLRYALKRNRYRCVGAYLAGAYTQFPQVIRNYLDTHISQQYEQINGKKKEKSMAKKNWKELMKWLFLNPEFSGGGENRSPWQAAQAALAQSDNRLDVCGKYDFVVDRGEHTPFSMEDYERHKGDTPILNWVIPEPGIGGGGHINIFRFVTRLQKLGFHNRIYLMYPGQFTSDKKCESFLEKYYEIDCSSIEVHIHLSDMEYAHAIIATSWQTAYAVRRFDNVISKFYFVQDYEPLFFAVGSEYTFAENTYRFGFRGITAGDWLKDKLREEFGMATDSFSFSYDRELYVPGKKRDEKSRVFFYARPYTARRAFEFGMVVLTEVAKRVPGFEVVFAGEDISKYKIGFKHVNAGIVPLSELSDLYAQCDMCLVLSNTNLSLLPLEIMASNSVAVCTRGANSEWLVNDENSIMVDFEVNDVIEKLVYYLEHKDKLEEKRRRGLEFAASTSWDAEAEKVRDALLRGIREDEKNINSGR